MTRLFLDTNVYIIGQLIPGDFEDQLLQRLGLYEPIKSSRAQVIISQELINQLLRVGKRLKGKDWSAKLVDQIWSNLNCIFIPESQSMKFEANQLIARGIIPKEDIYIYLGAKFGQADFFISANRGLLRAIADFPCLTAQEFVSKYLSSF